jgi:hypothetical protein
LDVDVFKHALNGNAEDAGFGNYLWVKIVEQLIEYSLREEIIHSVACLITSTSKEKLHFMM